MIQAIYFCVSESCSLDAQTNRISIFHVLDELNVVAFPTFLTSAAIIALLKKDANDPNEAVLVLKIRTDVGEVGSITLNADFVGKNRLRSIALLQGVLIQQQTASLDFILFHEDRELARWHVPVQFAGPSVVAPVPAQAAPPSTGTNPEVLTKRSRARRRR